MPKQRQRPVNGMMKEPWPQISHYDYLNPEIEFNYQKPCLFPEAKQQKHPISYN